MNNTVRKTKDWEHCFVSFKEGHSPEPVDFHSHSYYEISLILSGHVKTLLRNKSEDGEICRLVLSSPDTPHLVFLSSPSHYARLNLYFEADFVEHSVEEWGILSRVFGKDGNIIRLTEDERNLCRELMYGIKREDDLFRKKLGILGLLSHITQFSCLADSSDAVFPASVVDTVTFINDNYQQKITASALAERLNIGRTTLMTLIKKHTGLTLTEYVMRVRTKKAVELLRGGMSQEEAAALTGFVSGSGIIRAFRHCYGMTPGQYMKKINGLE